MNLFTKRFGLVLAGVVGVGAIASLAIGASFALFSNTSAISPITFSAGTVNDLSPAYGTCPLSYTNLAPGDSGSCTMTVTYGGSLPAYIGVQGMLSNETAGPNAGSASGLGVSVYGPSSEPVGTISLQLGVDGAQPTTPIIPIGNTGVAPVDSGTVYTVTVNYSLPLDAGDATDNIFQGTSVDLDLTFYAVQCSWNAGGYTAGSSPQNADCSASGDYPGYPASWS
ncbi:MAG: hypothetical protein WA809_10520 [Candidatus Dormiibacterota bacterium]